MAELPDNGLARLPVEVLLHILSYLDPRDITSLQLVSRAFRDVGRDGTFWRGRCYDGSFFMEAIAKRQALRAMAEEDFPNVLFGVGQTDMPTQDSPPEAKPTPEIRSRERHRIMANWDPSFPGETVSWYDEYIQRYAPVVVNWFQHPKVKHGSESEDVEARGLALYRPDNPEGTPAAETLLAVSPLDDGSVCIWDVNGSKGKRGGIVAKSKPGILFVDGPSADNSRRSKRVDSGVTECVSIDSRLHKAFFAVQSHLIEVDLQTLSATGCESYPWSITALSEAHAAVPLTVGTSLGIHLHDYRSRARRPDPPPDKVDSFANSWYEQRFSSLFDDEPLPPYASLSQPGPLSILHLPQPGAYADLSDDIYVAGRFSNVLHYDRRKFPSIKGSLHSGARLCSMACLPYPFSAMNSELRRKGELSLEQIERSKSASGGRTLIACGEYNTKGSLEMYGLSPSSQAMPHLPGGLQSSTMKNRQTSSQSKCLSVVNHGTRIAFSDGSGYLKWFERDGFTEVRRCRIGHSEGSQAPSLFASMPGSDDIARKLLATAPHGNPDGGRVNDNDLLFWTGEKLGLAGFSAKAPFTAEDFEEKAKDAAEAEKEREEREYGERMRLALERQADDVRFVRNLGWGAGIRG